MLFESFPISKSENGKLETFKNLCEQFVSKTRDEPKCLYYGFCFDGDVAHCREGYEDADVKCLHYPGHTK